VVVEMHDRRGTLTGRAGDAQSPLLVGLPADGAWLSAPAPHAANATVAHQVATPNSAAAPSETVPTGVPDTAAPEGKPRSKMPLPVGAGGAGCAAAALALFVLALPSAVVSAGSFYAADSVRGSDHYRAPLLFGYGGGALAAFLFGGMGVLSLGAAAVAGA